MNTNLNAVENGSEATVTNTIAPWKREGLPGMPILKNGNKFRGVPLGDLIRDDLGRIITAPRYDNAHRLMSAHLGKTIEPVTLYANSCDTRPVDTVAFLYAGAGRLSFMERRACATLAWVTANYYQPMKRRERIVLPTVLDDLPKELQSPRLNVQMWKIFTEEKAVMVADVLQSMFSDVEATVFEDGDGWYVAIDKSKEEFEGTSELERVETVMWVLSNCFY